MSCNTTGPVYNKNWRNSVAFYLCISSNPLGFFWNSIGMYCLIDTYLSEVALTVWDPNLQEKSPFSQKYINFRVTPRQTRGMSSRMNVVAMSMFYRVTGDCPLWWFSSSCLENWLSVRSVAALSRNVMWLNSIHIPPCPCRYSHIVQ